MVEWWTSIRRQGQLEVDLDTNRDATEAIRRIGEHLERASDEHLRTMALELRSRYVRGFIWSE